MRSGLIKGVVGGGDWRVGKSGSSSSDTGGGGLSFDSPTVVEDALALDLRFDQGTGTTLTDYSPNARNGTLQSSPLWLDDSLAGLDFQVADSDHVTFPTANYITSGNLTLEMVYRLTTNTAWVRVFDFGGTGVSGSNFFFTPNRDSSGFSAFTVTTGSDVPVSANVPSVLNTWEYWTVTLSSGNCRLYRNNLQVGSGTLASPANVSRSTNYLGRSNFPDPYFNGAIAMVRLYDKALSKAERCANFSQSVLWLLGQGIKI